MAIVPHFYNELTKKYVVIFGNMFNNIFIERKDDEGVPTQTFPVPIAYGPTQKWLSMLRQNKDLKQKAAITLPRMSFEMIGYAYDPERKMAKTKFYAGGNPADDSSAEVMYAPTPYNIEFELGIMVKNEEDGYRIIEQILPFFQPSLTNRVDLLGGGQNLDIPIVLNGITSTDDYEGDYESRRSIIWNLNFTMKALFFGPIRDQKIIRFIDTRLFSNFDSGEDEFESQVIVRPGLTATGEPTTDPDESVPYTDINIADDWDFIVETKHE